jgi:hypothetical protein
VNESQPPLDLERDLRMLRDELVTEQGRMADRIAALVRKERQAEARLHAVRQELEEARQERPRLARRLQQKQGLVVKETLGSLAETLGDATRGAWGDRLPIPATVHEGQTAPPRLTLILPVGPEVIDRWEEFAETPPLRITFIAYATLVKIASEYDLPGTPEAGAWDRFLTLSLDLGALRTEAVKELETMDAALFLDEATPKPWASGGREMTPVLVWVPAALFGPAQGADTKEPGR